MPDARGVVLLMICLLVAAPSPSDAFPFDGTDTNCTNEGEPVSVSAVTRGRLPDDPCLSCMCKNLTVTCVKQVCPSVATCPVARQTQGTCCRECKTCSYLGQTYYNDEHWGSSQDACRTLSCKAGVITIARMQCFTPCHNPQRVVGYCCPVCQPPDPGVLIATAEMALLENSDPCLQCTPNKEHISHCYRTACPALDCPLASQRTPKNKCCPECRITRTEKWSPLAVSSSSSKSCSFQLVTYDHLQSFRPDDCTLCTCEDGAVICKRFVCPTIDCPNQRLYFRPGLCCPFCRDRDPLSCTYSVGDAKHEYKHGVSWNPNECTNCTCANGESKCETQKCEYPYKCPRGYSREEREPGQCCHQCVEKEATCTVFGDPHYQTFDGFAYTFQGTCRYVLAQECTLRGDLPSFIVVAHNGPWERVNAAWTKHVTIRLQPPESERAIRISLLPNKRVKVQGKHVNLPHLGRDVGYSVVLDPQKNVVVRVTSMGIKVLWDGHSYVEVTLGSKHQGKVCGLCGNYNRVKDDDTVPQFGSEPTDDINDFAQSWRWGSADKCEAESDRVYHERSRLFRRDRKMSQLKLMSLLGPGSSLRAAPAPNTLNGQALLRVFRGSGRNAIPLTLASDPDSEPSLFPHWSSQKLSLFRYDAQGGRRLGDSTAVEQNSRPTKDGKAKKTKKRRRKEPKKRRSLKKLCGGSAKWRTRRGVIKQCRLLKSDLFRECRGVVKVGHYFRWCVQDACACPASGRCFCESLMAYARECERRSVSIDWRPQSHCPSDDACTVVGAQFSSCACERSCESPAAECGETCQPGCDCPPHLVQLDGRCVPLEQCPLPLSPPN